MNRALFWKPVATSAGTGLRRPRPDVRWIKITIALTRHDNLSVLAIDDADIQHMVALCGRTMCLQCLIQDGELQLIAGDVTLAIRSHIRMSDYAVA